MPLFSREIVCEDCNGRGGRCGTCHGKGRVPRGTQFRRDQNDSLVSSVSTTDTDVLTLMSLGGNNTRAAADDGSDSVSDGPGGDGGGGDGGGGGGD